MRPSFRIVAGVLGCLSLGLVAKAQFVNEPFNYTLGTSVDGQSGGLGITSWSGGTSSDIVSGVTYGSYATSGNAVDVHGDTLTTSISGFPGATTIFASFLVQINSTTSGNYGGFVYGNVFTGYDSVDSGDIGSTISGNNLSGSGDDVTGTKVAAGSTYLFVVEYSLTNNGGNYDDTVTTWYGANGATALTQIGGSLSLTSTAASDFNAITFSTDYDVSLDEVRLGTTFSSVAPGISAVPEPWFYELALGLAAAGFVLRREYRRRQVAVLA